jgi:predicted  nucleic acid-binding Zn-ribbon protein
MMIMSELRRLYEVQLLEAKLDVLSLALKELPVLEEYRALQAEALEMKKKTGLLESKLDGQRKRLKSLELDLQKVEEESKATQCLLYSGKVSNPKELAQLSDKAGLLQRERSKAEDSVLHAMEAAEETEKSLSAFREKLQSLADRLHRLQKQGSHELSGLKGQITAHQQEREKLLAGISDKLLSQYQELKPRFRDTALVLVDGEVCGGCRVALSTNLKNRLCNPAMLLFCENCGRILVP